MVAILLLAFVCSLTTPLDQPAQEERGDSPGPEAVPVLESWRFELDLGPRGEDAEDPRDTLPFLVEYDAANARAWVLNGSERIAVPNSRRDAESWTLDFPHYDSAIELRWERNADEQLEWRGTWTKERGRAEPAVVPARAVRDPVERFEPVNGLSLLPESVAGRWRVAFESGGDVPAVALLEAGTGVELTGTFLTDTGDYRFLAGDVSSRGLRLSCFDGAHAFLFEARIEIDPKDGDRLVDGVFCSGDWWGETWTAVRDDAVELPDPLARLGLRPTAHLEFLTLPDPSGAWHPLWTPGRPALIEVFGSWCPNCHDAARLLQELHERHGKELDVVGVAFELTGAWERDARQVERFREHHDLGYRLLVGGTANKADTARALGLTDRILSYPTTFFVDANGVVTAIYSGFSGPATGAAHLKLREDVGREVEAIVATSASYVYLAALLADTHWSVSGWPRSFGVGRGLRAHFVSTPSGLEVAYRADDLILSGRPPGHPMHVAGRTLALATKGVDRRLDGARLIEVGGRLLPTHDLRRRWRRADPGASTTALVAEQCRPALELDEPVLRAEGAWATGHFGLHELLPRLEALLTDPDTWVRVNAAAALAVLGGLEVDEQSQLGAARLPVLDGALRSAVTDPSHLVRREAARALAAWGLAPDLFSTWARDASPSPFDRDLARLYSAELSAR